jgi:hypothetical protein
MRELVRSNDMVLVSYIVDLLQQEGLAAIVFDVHMSILEGSVGVLPRRIMVSPEDENRRPQAAGAVRLEGASEYGQLTPVDGIGSKAMSDEFTQTAEPRDANGKAGLSDDAFLGGKLQLLQPEKGYRAGIDAVLLAASVPASDEIRSSRPASERALLPAALLPGKQRSRSLASKLRRDTQ